MEIKLLEWLICQADTARCNL